MLTECHELRIYACLEIMICLPHVGLGVAHEVCVNLQAYGWSSLEAAARLIPYGNSPFWSIELSGADERRFEFRGPAGGIADKPGSACRLLSTEFCLCCG
jgi:hypothetical protein